MIRATLFLSLAAPLAIGASTPLALIYAAEVLHAPTVGFSAISAVHALGLAIGTLLAGTGALDRPRGLLLAGGVTGLGVGQLLAYGLPLLLQNAVPPDFPLLLITLPLLLLGAIAQGAVFLALRTVVQEEAPAMLIGRVFNLITVAGSTAMAAGAALAVLADVIDVGILLPLWSLYLVVVGLVALRLWPKHPFAASPLGYASPSAAAP